MPDYRTHDLVCISAAPIVAFASLAYLEPKQSLLFGAAILLTNHYLSPDTDTKSIIDRRWSVLRVVWYPYRRMFHHRSFFTHSGPISATIRLLYLLLLLSPFLLFVSYYDVLYLLHVYRIELYLVYIAACVSDTIHTGLDFLHYGSKIFLSFWKNPRRPYGHT